MFALLFQRAVYFLTNPYQASMLSDPNRHDLLERLAQYMETAGTDGFEQEELVRTGSELLAEVEECDENSLYIHSEFSPPLPADSG